MDKGVWQGLWVRYNRQLVMFFMYILSLNSYYIGAFPRFIIANPDLLKDIMVKEFDKFSERRVCYA